MRGRAIALLPVVVAVAAVVAVSAGGGGTEGNRVVALVEEAANVSAGQYVREAGSPVGEVVSIDPVDGGRKAKVVLELEDRAWPVPSDSTFTLRWGGTANYGNRYIHLGRGDARSAWSQDEVLPARAFVAPPEFDALLRIFDRELRGDLRQMLNTAGPALVTARPHLRRALGQAPPALEQARAVFDDLDAERVALTTLVRTGERVLGAVDAAEPGLRDVLSGAAGTFDAIAAEQRSLRRTLDRAPEAFAQVRTTLRRADPTLRAAQGVTKDLAPGVEQIRRTAAPLNAVLGTLEDVGPDARQTLAALRTAAPDLTPLLAEVRRRGPQLQTIGDDGKEQLKCIRPYTPDAVAFFTNWGDFFSAPDGKDKMIRAQVQSFLPAQSNISTWTPGQAKDVYGSGLEYGFPRPPGTNAGQPWFLPECGAGPDALDPKKDPEARGPSNLFAAPKLQPLSQLVGGTR